MSVSTTKRPVAGGAARPTASRTRRWRARLGLLVAVLLCGTLAGCYASRDAQTAQETPDTRGIDGEVGAVLLTDVYLETAGPVPAGASVGLRAALTNDSPEPDRLVAVTTPVAASVELLNPDGTVATGGIEIPGEGQVDTTTGPVLIRLTGLTGVVSPLTVVPITFEFATAGRGTLDDVPTVTPTQGGG
jgi:copper(I)-binding protein